MYFGITDLTTFILGTIFIVLLPGPNSLYVMTVASRWGIAAGYKAACGIFVGDLVLMTLSATGVASLLRATPPLFIILKYTGAAYLMWLGFGLLRPAAMSWKGGSQKRPEMISAVSSRPFGTALAISLVNPKAILFFISFFVQFVSPDYPYPALSFLILGAIGQTFSAIYLSALIFGGTHLADIFRQRQWLVGFATGIVGVLFVGFAIKLAQATLS